MTRNHAFDIILKFLYDNNGHYWNMIQTCKEKLNITDGGMISSICKEMICNEWVTPKNQDKMSVAINYEGRMMIEKYGSYSSFLQFEKKRKKSGKWSTKLTTAKTFITIITTLGIFILGILNFKDNKTIKLQEIKIESLNKTIDSLKNELTKPMQLDIIQ